MSEWGMASGQGPIEAGAPISELFLSKTLNLRGKSREELERFIVGQIKERRKSSYNADWYNRTQDWPANMLMVYGWQDIEWIGEGAQRWMQRKPGRRRRYAENQLVGRVERWAAALTMGDPTWTAIPPTTDHRSRLDAKLSEKILLHDYDKLALALARFESTIDIALHGMGILEAEYNAAGGRIEVAYENEIDADGNEVLDEATGKPIPIMRNGRPVIASAEYTGAIDADVVSPFAFYVPPGLTRPMIRKSPWIIRDKWVSRGAVRRAFNLADDFPLESDPSDEFAAVMQSPSAYLSGFGQGRVRSDDTGLVLLTEYFELASNVPGFELGKVYSVVGNKLVSGRDSLFPDSAGRYPFACFPWFPRRNQFWPYPWVSPQRDSQSRLNSIVNHQAYLSALFGIPNVYMQKGSLGKGQQFAFAGKVYQLNPGFDMPQIQQPPGVPNNLFELYGQTAASLDAIGLNYPGSRGQHQAGIPSGAYLLHLQDADQAELRPFVNFHARAWEDLGEMMLELHRMYDTDERMMEIVGQGSEPELFQFRNSDIPLNMRVRVQSESILAYFKAAQLEKVERIAATGGFGLPAQDPIARKRLMQALNDPTVHDVQTPEDEIEEQAERLHSQILDFGQEVDIESWWDVEELLFHAHRRMVKESHEWEPETKERFERYLNGLLEAVQQAAMMEQQQAMQAQVAMMQAQAGAEGEEKRKTELTRAAGKVIVENAKPEKSSLKTELGRNSPPKKFPDVRGGGTAPEDSE